MGSKFQFHKGTIKPTEKGFNVHTFELFQFHKGTIKPGYELDAGDWTALFQFHKGTIKPLQTHLNKRHLAISIP